MRFFALFRLVLAVSPDKYLADSTDTTLSDFRRRHLTHELDPTLTPIGCQYSFNHGATVFVDEAFCPGWCVGDDYRVVVTTIFEGAVGNTTYNCYRENTCCTEGDCPCEPENFFNMACEKVEERCGICKKKKFLFFGGCKH